MRQLNRGLFVLVLLLTTGTLANGEMIVNGDFEAPDVPGEWACFVTAGTSAETISINFIGGREGETIALMAPWEVAGMQYVADDHWNNAQGRNSGTLYNLMDGSGANTGARVQWQSGLGSWSILNLYDNPGNDRMMRGYLDAVDQYQPTIVTVSGLSSAFSSVPYDVYVYFDGDNEGSWRIAQFQIGATTLDGEDSEWTDFHVSGQNPYGYFQLPTPGPGGNQPFGTPPPGNVPNSDEGNYLVFAGVRGDSFTLTAFGGPYSGGYCRAPLNGMQIVPVPESSTLALLGMGTAGLLAFASLRRWAGQHQRPVSQSTDFCGTSPFL